MSNGLPITHDLPVFPSRIAFDTSRLVGSPEDLRKLVAQEAQSRLHLIDESIHVITKLRTFHNSLAPVNALPAELLGMVFAQLVFHGDLLPKSPCEHFSPPQVDPPTGSRDIAAVASVCRYWRTVTLQNPWLWASFPIHDRIGVEEFLTRSKDLLISLTLTRRFPSNIAPVLAPSAHRIRSLYVSTELKHDISLLWAELSCPAPNLQELFIEHLPRNSFITGGAVGRAAHFSPMFNDEIPALRVLTLRGVPSPFKTMPPSLVHLDIGTLQDTLPSFREVLHMLGTCPLLETLDLRGSWDWNEFAHHSIVRNGVALPRLGAIRLFLEPQDAPGILLSSLALPAHTNVLISSVLEDSGDFVRILDTVVPQRAPQCFTGFRRLQLFRDSEWRLQAYRELVPDAFRDIPGLDIRCIDPWGDPQPEWTGFLLDWPFDVSEIETLVLSHTRATYSPPGGGDPVERDRKFDQWDDTLRQLPALKNLKVTGIPTDELESLLDVLRERAPGSAGAPCSNLTSLEIVDVQFSDTAADRLLDVAVLHTPDGTRMSTLRRVVLFNSKPSGVGFQLCRRVVSLGVEVVIDEENLTQCQDLEKMDIDILVG